MSKEKTIGERFKDGIIPRREWWCYEKCVPEDVLRGIDGSITVYVNEKAKGVVLWQ